MISLKNTIVNTQVFCVQSFPLVVISLKNTIVNIMNRMRLIIGVVVISLKMLLQISNTCRRYYRRYLIVIFLKNTIISIYTYDYIIVVILLKNTIVNIDLLFRELFSYVLIPFKKYYCKCPTDRVIVRHSVVISFKNAIVNTYKGFFATCTTVVISLKNTIVNTTLEMVVLTVCCDFI